MSAVAIAALLGAAGCSRTVSSSDDAPKGPLPRVSSPIVADDDNVYWSGSTFDGSSFRYVVADCPVSGGPTTILATAIRTDQGPYGDGASLSGTWINHARVFWVRSSTDVASIESAPIGGGPLEHFASPIALSGLAVDDANLFFVDESGKLDAVSLATGARRTIADGFDGCLAPDDATHLLACRPLARVSLTGEVDALGDDPAILVGSARGVVTFQTPPCDYYPCNADNDGGAEVFIQPGEGQPRLLAKGYGYTLDDAAVYSFTTEADGLVVVRTRLDDGMSRVVGHAEGEPLGIAVNRDTVFWLERSGTSELRVRQAPIPR